MEEAISNVKVKERSGREWVSDAFGGGKETGSWDGWELIIHLNFES